MVFIRLIQQVIDISKIRIIILMSTIIPETEIFIMNFIMMIIILVNISMIYFLFFSRAILFILLFLDYLILILSLKFDFDNLIFLLKQNDLIQIHLGHYLMKTFPSKSFLDSPYFIQTHYQY